MSHVTFLWHSSATALLTPSNESLADRTAHIAWYAPADERDAILGRIKVVKGRLPQPVRKAGLKLLIARAEYEHAREVYAGDFNAIDQMRKAWYGYHVAMDNYRSAVDRYIGEILMLHNAECPSCPWDGSTILPRRYSHAQS